MFAPWPPPIDSIICILFSSLWGLQGTLLDEWYFPFCLSCFAFQLTLCSTGYILTFHLFFVFCFFIFFIFLTLKTLTYILHVVFSLNIILITIFIVFHLCFFFFIMSVNFLVRNKYLGRITQEGTSFFICTHCIICF